MDRKIAPLASHGVSNTYMHVLNTTCALDVAASGSVAKLALFLAAIRHGTSI
jgi:hypothetical protein